MYDQEDGCAAIDCSEILNSDCECDLFYDFSGNQNHALRIEDEFCPGCTTWSLSIPIFGCTDEEAVNTLEDTGLVDFNDTTLDNTLELNLKKQNMLFNFKSSAHENLRQSGNSRYEFMAPEINFENLPGITGIFGRNARGKSSIIGTIAYTLFNTSDRGSIKNIHIINSRKNSCKSELDIAINNIPYRIIRQTVKKQTKRNVWAPTTLKFYKLDCERFSEFCKDT